MSGLIGEDWLLYSRVTSRTMLRREGRGGWRGIREGQGGGEASGKGREVERHPGSARGWIGIRERQGGGEASGKHINTSST